MAKIWRAGVEITVLLACGHTIVSDKGSKKRLRTAHIGDLWNCNDCRDAEKTRASE